MFLHFYQFTVVSAAKLPPANRWLSCQRDRHSFTPKVPKNKLLRHSQYSQRSTLANGTVAGNSAANPGAGTVYLLTTTNVAAPRNTWTPIWTNVLSGSSSLTTNLSNAVNPALTQQSHLLGNTNN